jgi:hypothetical protein
MQPGMVILGWEKGMLEGLSSRRKLFYALGNQVEIRFNIFTCDVIRGGIWRSKKELVDQIL